MAETLDSGQVNREYILSSDRYNGRNLSTSTDTIRENPTTFAADLKVKNHKLLYFRIVHQQWNIRLENAIISFSDHVTVFGEVLLVGRITCGQDCLEFR